MLSLGAAIKLSAFTAQSAAICSCEALRFNSSSFSRSGLAAPLSRCESSLKTSCMCSGEGFLPNHSRILAARSPEVGAENAPPVKASSGCAAGFLAALGAGVSCTVSSDFLLKAEKLSMIEKYAVRQKWRQPRIFAVFQLAECETKCVTQKTRKCGTQNAQKGHRRHRKTSSESFCFFCEFCVLCVFSVFLLLFAHSSVAIKPPPAHPADTPTYPIPRRCGATVRRPWSRGKRNWGRPNASSKPRLSSCALRHRGPRGR